MSVAVDILSWVLMTAGGVFVLIGGVGALRFPDVFTRLHAASLTDTMASILILVGIMLQAGWSLAAVKLLMILGFLLLTGPTASYAIANAALLSGLKPGAADRAKPSSDETETGPAAGSS